MCFSWLTLLVLKKTEISLEEIDLIEINEAFAAQAIACQKELKIDSEKLNKWGGAVAVGHPLAGTGTRITTTLARQMDHYNAKTGIASACIGGGQGIAILLRAI